MRTEIDVLVYRYGCKQKVVSDWSRVRVGIKRKAYYKAKTVNRSLKCKMSSQSPGPASVRKKEAAWAASVDR
jgi:hypothetical protein